MRIEKMSLSAACAVALLLPAVGRASTSYYIETSQSGAELTISSASSDIWSFDPTYGWELGGGIFTMKEGTSTTASIVLTLNDLTTSTSDLASVTLPASSIGQSYGSVDFFFGTTFTLTPGNNYQLVLSSTAASSNNTEYFIKDNGTVGFYDSSGDPLPAGVVPEPVTVSLLLAGVALIWLCRRTRLCSVKA